MPTTVIEQIAELVDGASPDQVAGTTGLSANTVRELARAFSDPALGPGRTLAVGGGVGVSGSNATAAQVPIALLNYVAGNIGATVDFSSASTLSTTATYADMRDLANDMRSGEVELAIVHNVNPVFTMPAAADFGGALAQVPFVASLSSLPDETTARADLLLPTHTPLESWGDSNPRYGVYGLIQPVMRPVFDTRTPAICCSRWPGRWVRKRRPVCHGGVSTASCGTSGNGCSQRRNRTPRRRSPKRPISRPTGRMRCGAAGRPSRSSRSRSTSSPSCSKPAWWATWRLPPRNGPTPCFPVPHTNVCTIQPQQVGRAVGRGCGCARAS